jgi:flagellin-like protein
MKRLGGGRMRGHIARLRRNVKGLSPIFAVLILIAIAVIAGIIVYMFTSGYLGTMMGGGTTGQEKVAIESVQVTATGISLWAKSTGGGDVVIGEVIIRDTAGNQVGAPLPAGVTLPADGALTEVPVTVSLTTGTYTAALISKEGGQFVSPSFKA